MKNKLSVKQEEIDSLHAQITANREMNEKIKHEIVNEHQSQIQKLTEECNAKLSESHIKVQTLRQEKEAKDTELADANVCLSMFCIMKCPNVCYRD